MSDTIAAIATPGQPSAIGILRLSGPDTCAALDAVFRAKNGRPAAQQRPRAMVLGELLDETGQVIDSVLCVHFPAPHSYTGEDCAELHCHGSPIVLDTGLRALFAAGCRQAGPGEFTKRAFLNGQLDLLQAESVADLIDAETAQQAHNAVCQLDGALSRTVARIYDGLMDMAARFYAVVDYPDEDIEDLQREQMLDTLRRAQNDLEALVAGFSRGRLLKLGVPTVLLGKPNAGKSSLLNALLGYDRAIVTDIAGTTRDTVEEKVTVGGVLLRLIDTAGIRATDDVVERIGVEKARAYVKEASLILALFDASRPLDSEDAEILKLVRGRDAILLLNKDDLAAVVTPAMLQERAGKDVTVITISTRTQDGLADLTNAITAKVYAGTQAGQEGTFVTDARQAEILRQADEHLEASIRTIEASMGLDFISIDLRSAWEKLGELTGETVGEDIINEIFSKFCIGK